MVSSEVHRHVREQRPTRSVKTIEMSHRVSAHRKLCERQTHLIQYSAGLMKAVMAHVSLLWMSHSGFFFFLHVLLSVYSLSPQSCLQRIVCLDYSDEQPLTARQHLWKHYCFFKVKSRRLPHEECVPSRSSHGTIEEKGEKRVEKGL